MNLIVLCTISLLLCGPAKGALLTDVINALNKIHTNNYLTLAEAYDHLRMTSVLLSKPIDDLNIQEPPATLDGSLKFALQDIHSFLQKYAVSADPGTSSLRVNAFYITAQLLKLSCNLKSCTVDPVNFQIFVEETLQSYDIPEIDFPFDVDYPSDVDPLEPQPPRNDIETYVWHLKDTVRNLQHHFKLIAANNIVSANPEFCILMRNILIGMDLLLYNAKVSDEIEFVGGEGILGMIMDTNVFNSASLQCLAPIQAYAEKIQNVHFCSECQALPNRFQEFTPQILNSVAYKSGAAQAAEEEELSIVAMNTAALWKGWRGQL